MWDLILSVPDHCLSLNFPYFMCANSDRAVSPEPSLFAYAISTIIS